MQSPKKIRALALDLCSRMSAHQIDNIASLEPEAIPIAVPEDQAWSDELKTLRSELHRAARRQSERPKAS